MEMMFHQGVDNPNKQNAFLQTKQLQPQYTQ